MDTRDPKPADAEDTRRPPRGKVARHDPCPCGTGRRLKDCCGTVENARREIQRRRA
jgi:uncharacterized protein YecA (UPF0149 family)